MDMAIDMSSFFFYDERVAGVENLPPAPCFVFRGLVVMAKPSRIAVRLVSEEGSGSFYIAKKNPTQKPEKMAVRKYDARLRKHVLFREQKMK